MITYNLIDFDLEKLKILVGDFLTEEDKEILKKSISSSIVKSFLIEHPFVCKDYRDKYYNDFSKRFGEFRRYSLRIHLFSKSPDEIGDVEHLTRNITQNQDYYLGYFVLRDTKKNSLGTTYINPKAYIGYNKENNYVLSKYPVHIYGSELFVDAFPWMQQDGNVTRCAQVSIWSVVRYFSQKYPKYSEQTAYQISSLAEYDTRKVPSKGLTVNQISQILSKCGFSSEIYMREYVDKNSKDLFNKILYSSIESGMPCIAGLEDKKHAVVVVGHGPINSAIKYCRFKKGIYDSSNLVSTLIISDDNYLPYLPILYNGRCDSVYSIKDIDSIVVPFYNRMYLDVIYIYETILPVLEDNELKLDNKCAYIRRVFLTSSKSFKMQVNKSIDEKYKEYCIKSPMPKFIWIIEYAHPEDYGHNKKVFVRILLDATAINNVKAEDAVINYKKGRKLYINENYYYMNRNEDEFVSIKRFGEHNLLEEKENIYINNLHNI
jgi:hypothetical protein